MKMMAQQRPTCQKIMQKATKTMLESSSVKSLASLNDVPNIADFAREIPVNKSNEATRLLRPIHIIQTTFTNINILL